MVSVTALDSRLDSRELHCTKHMLQNVRRREHRGYQTSPNMTTRTIIIKIMRYWLIICKTIQVSVSLLSCYRSDKNVLFKHLQSYLIQLGNYVKCYKNLNTFIFTVTSVQDMAVNFKMYSHIEVQGYKCKRVYFFLYFIKFC